MNSAVRLTLGTIGRYVFLGFLLVFFAFPLLWLVLTPFDRTPTLRTSLPDFTLANFQTLLDNPYALRSLLNSALLALSTMAVVLVLAALASYALSRVRIPGRDALLYALLLLSSIVTGTAAMVPTFLLMYELNLIDSQIGVILVLAGGLLPAAIFILKDFMDATPRSYEESAPHLRGLTAADPRARRRAAGQTGSRDHRGVDHGPGVGQLPDAVHPAADAGEVACGRGDVHLLHRGRSGRPVADLDVLAAVLPPGRAMFLFVSRRYGFRFHGGIKR